MERITVKKAEELIKSPEPFASFYETTKEFVDWALDRNIHNRKLRKEFVGRLADDMEAGDFVPTSQGIGFSVRGLLIDGQHRLIANQKADYPPIWLSIHFGLPEAAQINVDQGVGRYVTDILKLSRNVTDPCSKAAVLIWLIRIETGELHLKKVSPAVILRYYDKYKDSLDDIWRSVKDGGFPAPFFAPIVYLRQCMVPFDRLVEFRDGCITGENLGAGDPRLTWRRKIHNLGKNSGKYSITILHHTMAALNKFLAERPLSSLPAQLATTDQIREQLAKLKKTGAKLGNPQLIMEVPYDS